MSELTPQESAALRARVVSGADGLPPQRGMGSRVAAVSAAVVVVTGITAASIGLAVNMGRTDTLATPSPTVSRTATATPTATPTPTPSPTAVPEPSVAPASAPPSRFAVDCGDLAGPISALFDSPLPVTATAQGSRDEQSWAPGPAASVFERDGSLFCEYGEFDPRGEGTWARLYVVHDAAALWEDSGYAVSRPVCSEAPTNCSAELLLGDVFIGFHSVGQAGADDDARTTAMNQALGEIGDLARPIEPTVVWTAPGDAPPVDGCEALLPASVVSELTGRADLVIDHPSGGWSPESWLMTERFGADPCIYGSTHEFDSSSMLTWLPGGLWAFEELAATAPLAGVGQVDTNVGCVTTAYSRCWVDFAIDGTWFRFTSMDFEGPSPERDALFAAVVGTVASGMASLTP